MGNLTLTRIDYTSGSKDLPENVCVFSVLFPGPFFNENTHTSESRNLAFVRIEPKITIDTSIVTKRFREFSPAARLFYEEMKAGL